MLCSSAARTVGAVPSGRNDRRSSWSVNEYISFSTMSVASPTARTKRSVFSTIGVRMLRYPYCSKTSRTVSSKTCHNVASSGRTSFMPRTAWILPAMGLDTSRGPLNDRLDGDGNGIGSGRRLEVRRCRLAAIGRANVIGNDLLELLGDALALERDRLLTIDVDRRDRDLTGAGQANADVGHFRFARAVDHATHDRHRHALNPGIARAPTRHLLAQIRLDFFAELLEYGAGGAPASWAGGHLRREGTQPHGLQNLLRDENLARAIAVGLGRERNPDRVADPLLQQHRHCRRRRDDALRPHSRLGQTEMQGIIAATRKLGINRDQVLHARNLA